MGSKVRHYVNTNLRVDGTIEYIDDSEQFVDIDLVLGTYRIAADLTERNAIPEEKRMIGMECLVLSDDRKYRLVGGILNANWVLVTEVEILKDQNLPNGGSDSIIIGDITQDKVIFIKYSIIRGTLIEVGELRLTNKADTYISRAGFTDDDAGFLFEKSISGNDIQLDWTDVITDGNSGTLELTITRQTV